MSVDPAALLELALHGAHEAGDILLRYFRGPVAGVHSKSTPTDLASDADRASESFLMALIARERPGDGVLAEEGGAAESTSGLQWLIDPLDGTINFLFGIPIWSVSIAAEDSNGAIVGVVYDPNLDETFTAIRGGGAYLNGGLIHVRDGGELARALIGTGFSYDAAVRAVQARVLQEVLPKVRDVRRPGSAALDLSYVACGRLDGFFESTMEPYDRAAGALVIQEAGGVVTELPSPLGRSHGVIAANPGLHDKLRALVLANSG